MYASSISDLKPGRDAPGSDGEVGDLAVIFDKNRRFVAIGLYDPDSPIRIRILHQGSPKQIDDTFWRDRLGDALALREPLLDAESLDAENTGWRWVSGENDGLPGLVLDCYDRTLVVKLDSGAWFPHLGDVISQAIALRPVDAVVLRLSRSVRAPDGAVLADGAVLLGEVNGDVSFVENGHPLTADVIRGQKTGYFLDQRSNRKEVGSLAEGHDVLDVFSCTGGFTVAALAGGAKSVHAVDRSTHAIDAVHRHAASFGTDRLTTAANDAFDELETLAAAGRRFGVVVVDPPSFATAAKDVDRARRAYRRLTVLAEPLVQPDGWLVQASCTARVSADDFIDDVLGGLRESGRLVLDYWVTGHDIDHPVGFAEGAYLKCVFAQLG